MLEQQKTWKRETGFDRIGTIATMREQHVLGGFHLEPLYATLYNPRWPHTPEEHTLKIMVDVKRLRTEIIFRARAAAAMWFVTATVACGRYGVR